MKNTALKSTSILIVLFASLLQLGAAPAKDSPRDPLEGAFFPPDLVMLAGDHISLTQGQREKLQRAAQQVQSRSEELRQRLTEKVERVQAGAQKWAESGRDPSAILKTMEEKFKPLMDAGKITEAEAELDRVLERFRQEQK